MTFKEENKIYIEDESGKEVARIIFEESDGIVTITHTIVDDSMSGKGIAGQLLDKVVEKARRENKKIVPVCSYAAKKLNDNEKYADVLK